MPVWHASVSLWNVEQRKQNRSPGRLERAAVNALAGVGNDREWWIYAIPPAQSLIPVLDRQQMRQRSRPVGHLRVGLTADEAAQLAYYPVVGDAGPAGPQRRRTVVRLAAKQETPHPAGQ